MTDFKDRIANDWQKTLHDILARARKLGEKAVLVFDLDSTLFDNRVRQVRIVREFGEQKNVPELTRCDVQHWDSGWDMRAAMRNCGLSSPAVERLYPALKAFWQERFFTSDYAAIDTAIEGAPRFIRECVETGAQVVYVTGRHEGMRKGTVECMRTWSIAEPQGRVQLLMKPTLAEDDDSFKRMAHEKLRELGTVIAAFDNEPTHANDYRRKFPDATVVHLATDHSGRDVTLLDGIVTVPHFALELA